MHLILSFIDELHYNPQSMKLVNSGVCSAGIFIRRMTPR